MTETYLVIAFFFLPDPGHRVRYRPFLMLFLATNSTMSYIATSDD